MKTKIKIGGKICTETTKEDKISVAGYEKREVKGFERLRRL